MFKPKIHSKKTAIAAALLLIGVLTGFLFLWNYSPLARYADIKTISYWLKTLENNALLPLFFLGAYLLGGVIMFPMTLLNAGLILVFGPLEGLGYAYAGNFLSGLFTFGLVRMLGRGPFQSLSGQRLLKLSERIASRGVFSVIIMRNFPISFGFMSMVAALSHIRFWDYFRGTMVGIIPGLLLVTFFAGGLKHLIYEPRWELLALLLITGIIVFLGQKWIRSKIRKESGADI